MDGCGWLTTVCSFDEIPGLYHWQKHDYLRSATNAVQSNKNLGEKIIGR